MDRRHFLFAGCSVALQARNTAVDFNSGARRGIEIVKCADGSNQLRLQRLPAGGHVSSGEYETAPLRINGGFHLRWIPQWITPQRYRKHDANPVYGPRQSGAWDNWTNGVGIVRTADGARYHMYYADQKNGIGYAVASVSEPTIWKEHASSPVLRPTGEPHWEGDRLNQPRMAKVTATHWRMYYTGWGQDLWRLGLAESFDAGVTWQRHSDQPVLPLGKPGDPDAVAACVPMVLKHEGLWRMWYTGSADRSKGIHICYAVSEDGVHWKKHTGNPVLATLPGSNWESSVISRPYAFVEDGVFKMWYSMRGKAYRIGYAESVDGIRWERSPVNPVLDVSAEGWDSDMVEYPELDKVDGVYRMWYCGNGFGTVGYAEGIPQTQLEIRTRTGTSSQPDATWSPWSPPYTTTSGQNSLSPSAQYVQLMVRFSTSDPKLTPALRLLEVHS